MREKGGERGGTTWGDKTTSTGLLLANSSSTRLRAVGRCTAAATPQWKEPFEITISTPPQRFPQCYCASIQLREERGGEGGGAIGGLPICGVRFAAEADGAPPENFGSRPPV
ncbi:hypothetical protein VE00_04581 [Pseudogymnoascus sp. WSF 3629]|nr:hypothetical protein VE00_04581 [Pseudogymnoascus sp. WSF 3629]